jgi:hypothetical protein
LIFSFSQRSFSFSVGATFFDFLFLASAAMENEVGNRFGIFGADYVVEVRRIIAGKFNQEFDQLQKDIWTDEMCRIFYTVACVNQNEHVANFIENNQLVDFKVATSLLLLKHAMFENFDQLEKCVIEIMIKNRMTRDKAAEYLYSLIFSRYKPHQRVVEIFISYFGFNYSCSDEKKKTSLMKKCYVELFEIENREKVSSLSSSPDKYLTKEKKKFLFRLIERGLLLNVSPLLEKYCSYFVTINEVDKPGEVCNNFDEQNLSDIQFLILNGFTNLTYLRNMLPTFFTRKNLSILFLRLSFSERTNRFSPTSVNIVYIIFSKNEMCEINLQVESWKKIIGQNLISDLIPLVLIYF